MRSQYFYVQRDPTPTSREGLLLTDSVCSIIASPAIFESVPHSAIGPVAQSAASALSALLGHEVPIDCIAPPPEFDWSPYATLRIVDAEEKRVVTLSLERRGCDLLTNAFLKTLKGLDPADSAPLLPQAALEVIALELLNRMSRETAQRSKFQLLCSLDVSLREETAASILHIDLPEGRAAAIVCVSGNWDLRQVAANVSPRGPVTTPELQIAFPPLRIDPELMEALQANDLLRTTVAAFDEPHQLHLITTTGWSLGECKGVVRQADDLRLHLDEIELWPAQGFDGREPDIIRPTLGRLSVDRAKAMKFAPKKALHIPYSNEIVTLWCQGRVIATGRLIEHDSQLTVEITNPPS